MISSVNKYWKLLLPEKGRGWLFLIFVHMGLTGLIGFLLPSLTEKFYQNFTQDPLTPFLVLGGLFFAEYVNRLGYQISTYKFVQHLLGETRARTFSLWMRAPFKLKKKTNDDDFPMGEVLARVMSDSDSVKELVTSGAFAIFIDFIFIIFSLVGLLRINSTLGIGLFSVEVLMSFFLVWGSRKMGELFASVRFVTGLLSRVVADVTRGLRELAFTPHNNYASQRGDQVFDDFLKKQLKANVWDASYYAAAESLYPILLALMLFFFPSGEAARVALLAVLIDLIQKSISPIKEVASKITSIQRAKTGLERITEFQSHFSGHERSEMILPTELESLSVKLSHYTYPPREGESGFSLQDISFSGKPGELIGIVGASGCGKSTLLRLLSAQHGSFTGEVVFNYLKINPEHPKDLEALCHQVSLVSQDSHVFSASVAFNISLEAQSPGLDQFWIQAQSALPYLRRWGIHLESLIDPRSLSLGQKQLLSGLRACYLRKPIVLFDEVSSGLDPDLERALRDLVMFVQRHSLTIIVTHRVETILAANLLVVMDKGSAVDSGTPKELEQRSELFNEFISHLKNT
ncbi:MAG: ABC transporter ATP-binding protein/permease [Bacteriovoracaceae bacterium]|nr:ABC transporter ATP-binding protein/permease [Bacteriovoracaceae bacterium]